MTIEIVVPPHHKDGVKLMCPRTPQVAFLSAGAAPAPLAPCAPLGRACLGRACVPRAVVPTSGGSLVITLMVASRCRMPDGVAHTVAVPAGAAPGTRLRFKVKRPQGTAPPAGRPAAPKPT